MRWGICMTMIKFNLSCREYVVELLGFRLLVFLSSGGLVQTVGWHVAVAARLLESPPFKFAALMLHLLNTIRVYRLRRYSTIQGYLPLF